MRQNADIAHLIKEEIIDKVKSEVSSDMRVNQLKLRLESDSMFRSMKKELNDVVDGVKGRELTDIIISNIKRGIKVRKEVQQQQQSEEKK